MVKQMVFWGIAFLTGLTTLTAQPAISPLAVYFEAVRAYYEGTHAHAHTAFVARHWRLPGNTGFDAGIYHVRDALEQAGYVAEDLAGENDRLTYRLERYPMDQPTWEPVAASLRLEGEAEPLLAFPANRNLIAINSYPTPPGGVTAELVYLPGCGNEYFDSVDVRGKIVMADCHSFYLFRRAVLQRGALGVLSYQIPSYNQPERYPDIIPFRSVPFDPDRAGWCLNLSYRARETLLDRLEEGPVRLTVEVQTRSYPSEELMLVAELRGGKEADSRIVYSAHMQEPGANDNASGVGCLTEMAAVAARLLNEGRIDPARTLTFLWGDEIEGTQRYLAQDRSRQEGILWGLSLDMVGEDTEKTGGSFLIEKMPDPSAIWTRGEDRHTEWGAANLTAEDLFPHYLNDYLIQVCRQQAAATGWTVNTNPFEGGSDHQPFLDAGIAGVLFWHFTDVYYHTDGDLIDKVSPRTLYNVGVSSLVAGLAMSSADEHTARWLADLLEKEATRRLEAEFALSREAILRGRKPAEEAHIVEAWSEWYRAALLTVAEVPVSGAGPELEKYLREKSASIREKSQVLTAELTKE